MPDYLITAHRLRSVDYSRGVTYRLRLDPTMHKIYAGLPVGGRRDLAVCLLDALADPIGASEPYGEDDGVMRTVARGMTAAVLLVNAATGTITVLQITYVG